jgi:transposase
MTPYEKRAVNWLLAQLGIRRRCLMPGRPSHLSDEQKAEVRAVKRHERARRFQEMAKRFGVSARTIYRVAR